MSETSSNRPVTALVLGIIGILCCALCGPIAWFIAKQELNAIAAGHAPAAGEGMAKAGLILGIIGTVLLVFSVLWIFLFGGMAFFQSLANR